MILGAFLMTGLEMVTALALKLPVICVILRDGELGMISGLQRAQQNEVYCTHAPQSSTDSWVTVTLYVPHFHITSSISCIMYRRLRTIRCWCRIGESLTESMCPGA